MRTTIVLIYLLVLGMICHYSMSQADILHETMRETFREVQP